MARFPLESEFVKSLTPALLHHYFEVGSVGALCNRLNESLRNAGEGAELHPNRLHTLFGDDRSKGVNESTLTLLKIALKNTEPPDRTNYDSCIKELNLFFETSLNPTEEDITHLANRLNCPRFFASSVSGNQPLQTAQPTINLVRTNEPDWSFQDEAVSRTIEELAISSNRKTGLILPTGGGKTRIAMRIVLRTLNQSANGIVVWVTHRRSLHRQAQRELQAAMRREKQTLKPGSEAKFKDCVKIIMLGDLASTLEQCGDHLDLVVVDEAHHAAAQSYSPIFLRENTKGVFLTATPNRPDQLPIGIDSIAYSITYRELFDRGVILEPSFETPLTIEQLNWDKESCRKDLCDYVIERTEVDFQKVLVVASRKRHVEEIYSTFLQLLSATDSHPLSPDDIRYVHGEGSSTGIDPIDFLESEVGRDRGVLISTTKMLGEGFDDPDINSVVITYSSSSMIQLMQAAGRALRASPGKSEAFVVQVRDSSIGYHYENEWLYQDISDELRPFVSTIEYSNQEDFDTAIDQLLGTTKLSEANIAYVKETAANEVEAESTFSILFSGLPFTGNSDDFYQEAEWHAHLIPSSERNRFLEIFNYFSSDPKNLDPENIISAYSDVPGDANIDPKSYLDALLAMRYAKFELDGTSYVGRASRIYNPELGTSWLKYLTFRYKPQVDNALLNFLNDVENIEEILNSYSSYPENYSKVVKVPIPGGKGYGGLIRREDTEWFENEIHCMNERIRGMTAPEREAYSYRWFMASPDVGLSKVLLKHFLWFADVRSSNFVFNLD